MIRPLYEGLMRLGESVVKAQTIAGALNWRIDELTSQQFLLGTYELYMQEAFSRHVGKGATVYDVGAHAGYHSLVCALLGGKVIAFEPNPANRESIQRQLLVNPQAQVTISPYALGDLCGSRGFDASSGNSQGHLSDEGELVVEVRQIDFLIEHENYPEPDLIKIDVEGHEEEVLLGARATIGKCLPVILCDRNDDTTFSRVSALLAPRGYLVTDGWPITAVPAKGSSVDTSARSAGTVAMK